MIDTEDAILYAVGAFDGEYPVHFGAIALDPITGILWGFEDFYWESYIMTLDGEFPQYKAELDLRVTGADYDRSGQLWVTADQPFIAGRALEPGESGLATLDPNTGANPFEAAWADPEFASEAITVWGHEVLPATGPAPAFPARSRCHRRAAPRRHAAGRRHDPGSSRSALTEPTTREIGSNRDRHSSRNDRVNSLQHMWRTIHSFR